MRDNTTQARVATTQEVVAQRSEWRELLASDEALADIYMRGLEDFRRLTPLEQERFDLLMRSFLHRISAAISARDAELIGDIPAFENRVIEGELLRLLDEPGFRDWWEHVDRRSLAISVVTLTDEMQAFRRELQGEPEDAANDR